MRLLWENENDLQYSWTTRERLPSISAAKSSHLKPCSRNLIHTVVELRMYWLLYVAQGLHKQSYERVYKNTRLQSQLKTEWPKDGVSRVPGKHTSCQNPSGFPFAGDTKTQLWLEMVMMVFPINAEIHLLPVSSWLKSTNSEMQVSKSL
jgi:hypothetical protein